MELPINFIIILVIVIIAAIVFILFYFSAVQGTQGSLWTLKTNVSDYLLNNTTSSIRPM